MMENNDQERIEIINNITMISRGNAGTWQAGKDLIGHMLIAEQNGQNFAYILNVQGLNDYRFEFIEAILSPKARLSNKSVLQKYLESDNISPADKYTAKQALMRTLFLSEPGLLQEYLESNDIQPENKQQCLNVLANNSKIIEDYLTHHSCKVSFIETLFKPREELGDQSYFDKIENQQSIKDALLLNKDVFGEYLTDARISPQSKQQYLNKLAGNVGEHGAIENYLADNRVIEILFEPQDGLNGQSYFDGIENKQSIVSGLMSGAYQSSLNRYLHLDYMINWEMFDLEKRQRCLNKLAGNDGEEGAIEYYLTIPYNDFDKKVELIKILFEPRGELGGQSYFDRIENKQSIVGGILANNLSLLDMYHPTTYEPDRRKRENNERKAIENRLRNLNKLAGNVGEHGAIENYLSNPNNDDNKKVELMKTLFKPRGELDGQSYFDGIENQQSILNSLLSGNNHSVLEQYLADHDIDRYGKQQCMNRFVNSRAIENYLTNLNNDFDKKADLIETLFKPRDYLNGQSYFDKIENKQSILNSLLSGNNHSVLEQYLADHDIDRYDKQQCMNRLVNSRAIEYYLTIPYDDFDKKADLIETLFKPRGELGGQSYFDRIENQQPEKHAILSNNAVLEQYLANERISLQNKQLCLNKLAGNDGEEGAIEYYLTAPYNYFDKKVDLIETLFKPRDYLNGQSYFDKIENKQSVARGILSDHNFRRFLERYLTDNNIEPQNRQQCLNGLSRYPETANWLAQVNQNRSSGLIKILFEPQDELNGQSYFDRIENKQLIRNSFLAVEDQPLLERYLADDQIGANDKLQCLNGLNSYPETQDLLRRVPLEQELAVIQTLFEPQNDDLNNQLPLDQYLNDINIPVKNKARTLNSIFTIIERMNEEDAVRINMLNGLKNTLTRQSFVTNFEQGTIQMQRLAIGNAGNEEQAENVALPENVENEEHLQDRKTTFLHIMMDPRYDPEYDENLNITTSDINREEVIQKIGRICPELLLDAKDQLGNTILNQTILLPYPSTVWGEQPEQQVRGNANQENNGNQQNHINQENHEENGQVPVVGEQAAPQVNREVEEKKDQQVCRKLLDYDDTIKFQLMHLLINANTDILYPRIQQMGQGQQVVPLAEQQVGGNANQENNGNQENHEENGQVVQRREADSPLIMLLKNNNWLLFGKILYGIELQFQTKLDRLFSEIKNQTLRAALSTASLALFSATGIGGSRGYNTCDFRYFLNNNPDDDLIESRKLNTKLVPELKKCYDSASELKSDNNYILYKELNFYLPRLENARNLYNQEEVINLFNVKFEDRTFEDTINDYLSCYQATKNTLKIIHQQNQIQNGLAPVVRGQAEPEVAPPAEQQVGDNANQENNGNLQNQGDDGNDNQPHNPNQPQQPNNQGVALNNNDENALQVRVGNRNVVLNQLERPEVRRGDNENPAREIELAPINPQNNQDDLQNEPNHPERPRVRRGDDENPAMSPLRNILPANPQNQADNNHERENLLAELKRAFDEEQAAQEARGKREEDETNRRGCCRRR